MSYVLMLLTIGCVVGIAVGQLLFKTAALTIPHDAQAVHLLTNGWLWAALVLYGAMTVLWIWILRHAPLHVAYPFMGLAFLIVPLLAWAFLKEPLYWQTLVGGALILAGVALASMGTRG